MFVQQHIQYTLENKMSMQQKPQDNVNTSCLHGSRNTKEYTTDMQL